MCENIKHDEFERDFDVNSIKTLLMCLIDNKFTMYEESFAKVFLEHLKVIRAHHYENGLETCENRQLKGPMYNRCEVSVATLKAYEKINNNVKGGSMRSIASSKISNYSGQKRFY